MSSLPEVEVKIFRLITLIKEVSKEPGINFAVWLLKFPPMKNILMKRSQMRKENYKICGSSSKGAPGSRMDLNLAF